MRALALLVLLLAAPAHALEPEERLPDPALEERAREISLGLRCVVCQNQSIDDSDASIARDMRRVVRERLVAGDDDRAVEDYLVARYGEYVLLAPRWSAATLLLWTAPLLLLAGAFAFFLTRRAPPEAPPLSEAEAARLDRLR